MSESPGQTQKALVVVGIDGGEDTERVVRYAVEEAERAGSDIRLVHVTPEPVPLAPMLPLVGAESLRGIGAQILSTAAQLVRELAGEDVQVEEVLAHGPRVTALLAYANDATTVVVGRRSPNLDRIATGSTSYAMAGRARCPVLVVPGQWTPDRPGPRRVVAAVDGSAASADVIGAGFAAAEARGAELVVLHAWRPPKEYDKAFGARAEEAWNRQAEPSVWGMVAGWRADHPEVPVSVELCYENPSTALVHAAQDADLLVMGRRGDGGFLGLSLGSKVRTLLRSGSCPVEIVPIPRPEPINLPQQAEVRKGGLARSTSSRAPFRTEGRAGRR